VALPVPQLVYDGYGEIDLHVHHDELGTAEENRKHMVEETRFFLVDCRRWGMFTTAEAVPQTRFAFIHGMWALDNSRRLGGADGHQSQYCGVDTELSALRELGCYADFMFPSHNVMDPQVKNDIFYARDDDKPWSYGNPDWVFVKLHTHGVQQQGVGIRSTTSEGTSTLWGDEAEAFWSHVEAKHSDGRQYRVHYMSAREACNVVRAAQDGRTGNAYDHRDYAVPPYASSVINAAGAHALESWRNAEVVLRRQEAVESAAFSVRSGQANSVVEEPQDGVNWITADGTVNVTGGSLQVEDDTPSEFYRIVDLGPIELLGSPIHPQSDRWWPGTPNPFSQQVVLSYRTGTPTPVRIEVFDLRGRRVRNLVNDASVLGEAATTWDGRDDQGRQMPVGLYMCRMTTRNMVTNQSLVYVR
jgi:hypothetical protein